MTPPHSVDYYPSILGRPCHLAFSDGLSPDSSCSICGMSGDLFAGNDVGSLACLYGIRLTCEGGST